MELNMKTILLLTFVSFNAISHPFTPCDAETGMADIYACNNIDLMRRVHFEHMGGTVNSSGSDIWGWTDPETSKEYALMTIDTGTSFIDISDPKEPIYLGILPTATFSSSWRDVKTYKNHAYIVSEASGHGMQVFDLNQLRDISNPPISFISNSRYSGFGSAHNIVINEESGFAYAVGTQTCNQGLHIINLQIPSNPTNAGCFNSDGYTHDAQCVMYNGPDNNYTGKEICFNANEDTITIVDVTNKTSPTMISRTGYSQSQYTHQGWLTENQRYFLMNDEKDEQRLGHKTKTFIWDMLDLTSPTIIGFYYGAKNSIDHNIYIKGNLAYLSNYTSGLSIVDIAEIGSANIHEVASFDTFPNNDGANFNGSWSNYPFFESGNIIVSDINSGLFILRPKICPSTATGENIAANPVDDNSIKIDWQLDLSDTENYSVFRSEGGCQVDSFIKIADNITTNEYIDNSVTGLVPVGYKISKSDSNNVCVSDTSACVETQTTGLCTAAPAFSGVTSVSSSNSATCGMDIKWNAATSYCQSNVSYDIYKSTDPAFVASSDTKVASNITSNQWHDSGVLYDENVYYMVRARDQDNQNQDRNVVKLAAKAVGELSDGTWEDGAEIQSGGSQNNKSASFAHIGWEFATNRKHSGDRSYWSQANNDTCNDLTTDFISLTSNKSSELSFWTAYDIENDWDGGVVEVTTDGNLFYKPDLEPSYPNNFNESADACNYSAGTPSFSGKDLTWKKHTVDLSKYNGQEIKVRWNYSTDNVVVNEGWYLDDLKITHTQTAGVCKTSAANVQPGLWYDQSRNGHGFAIEPVGYDDLYYTLFYSYRENGTPEWFSSLSKLQNGILNINTESNTLQRSFYDFSVNPADNNPIIIDDKIGTNTLQIDFNSDNISGSYACSDGINRGEVLALAKWQIGDQQESWCLEPIISSDNTPPTDLGGTWWAGLTDTGWGASLAFSNDSLVAIVYFYDSDGNPRWVIGQQDGFNTGQNILIDLFQVQAYGRIKDTTSLTNIPAGTLKLRLNNNSQDQVNDGELTIDVTYMGAEGGNWSRNNLPITLFSQPH